MPAYLKLLDARGIPQQNRPQMIKRLLPYFALLKPVKLHFIGAAICGLIYGVASGFSFPVVIGRIAPLEDPVEEAPGQDLPELGDAGTHGRQEGSSRPAAAAATAAKIPLYPGGGCASS